MSEPLWTARVLTLFPEMFPGPLQFSLAGRALAAGIWTLETTNIRDFALDRHGKVDDAPFGGGAGLVMRPDVLAAAIDAVRGRAPAAAGKQPLIYFSPRGRQLDQALVRDIAAAGGAIMLCGRYEGVDQRLIEARGAMEVSLGDMVLSGGEIAALALIDAAVRLLPGVVGEARSLDEESFAAGLLEYPHYTRPQLWEGRSVPDVLLSGNHQRIRSWRQERAVELTRAQRPDLWARYVAQAGKEKVKS
jgi:tRNA (guanine37-N1)-methyltransferase